MARGYHEVSRANGIHVLGRDPLDPGQRRRLLLDQYQEPRDRLGVSLDLGEDAVDIVTDQAGKTQTGREAVDEGPETDALDDAFDVDPGPDPFAHDSSVIAPLRPRRSSANVRGRDPAKALDPGAEADVVHRQKPLIS